MKRLSLNISTQIDLLIEWQSCVRHKQCLIQNHFDLTWIPSVPDVLLDQIFIIYVLTAVCTDNLSPLVVIFKFTPELRSR